MGDDEHTKTYEDESFYGKAFPAISNLDFVVGNKEDFKTNGVITVAYFFNTFYKGGFVVNEELSVMAEKHKDVQFIAIANDPEREKVEKLLKKIAEGTCCDPITKQVWRLQVPFVAHDAGKVMTKAMQDIQNVSVLHTPQAFILDAQGNLVWRQGLLQTFNFSNCNFEKQLEAVKGGQKVEQVHGKKPKVEVEGEDAEGDGEMSLW